MAGDATSAYLTLAQTVPPADDDTSDTMYALFHHFLAIPVSVQVDDPLPACSPKFLLDMRASTTFVNPRLAERLGWKVRKGTVQMQVRLARGMVGPLVTDTVVRSFSLGGHMYRVNGVSMDLHGTYDGTLGLNFFTQHGLLVESNSFDLTLCSPKGEDIHQAGLQRHFLSDTYEGGGYPQDSHHYSPWSAGMDGNAPGYPECTCCPTVLH